MQWATNRCLKDEKVDNFAGAAASPQHPFSTHGPSPDPVLTGPAAPEPGAASSPQPSRSRDRRRRARSRARRRWGRPPPRPYRRAPEPWCRGRSDRARRRCRDRRHKGRSRCRAAPPPNVARVASIRNEQTCMCEVEVGKRQSFDPSHRMVGSAGSHRKGLTHSSCCSCSCQAISRLTRACAASTSAARRATGSRACAARLRSSSSIAPTPRARPGSTSISCAAPSGNPILSQSIWRTRSGRIAMV